MRSALVKMGGCAQVSFYFLALKRRLATFAGKEGRLLAEKITVT